MEPWQSQALYSALKTLCDVRPPSLSQLASSGTVPPSASEHLSSAIPLSVLSILNVISPKASRFAFLELEECARQFPRPDLVNQSGEPPHRPHLLRDLTQLFVERSSGRVLARVGAAKGDGGGKTHVVVLRDLRCPDEKGMAIVKSEDAGLMDVNCDCKAFSFRAAGETLCKHVVVAVVAAAANFAPRCFVTEDEFLDMLRHDS